MTAVVRHTTVTNTTGALLTTVPINVGKENSTVSIEWTFSANEVGAGAGQLQDATNPSKGLLFGQFYGSTIKRVFAPSFVKNVTINGTTTWYKYLIGTTTNVTELNFRVDNSVVGVSSLYLLDTGTDATTQLAAGNKVVVFVEIGNT